MVRASRVAPPRRLAENDPCRAVPSCAGLGGRWPELLRGRREGRAAPVTVTVAPFLFASVQKRSARRRRAHSWATARRQLASCSTSIQASSALLAVAVQPAAFDREEPWRLARHTNGKGCGDVAVQPGNPPRRRRSASSEADHMAARPSSHADPGNRRGESGRPPRWFFPPPW